jgi:hypothetical protein
MAVSRRAEGAARAIDARPRQLSIKTLPLSASLSGMRRASHATTPIPTTSHPTAM